MTSFALHYYIFNKRRWADAKIVSCQKNNTVWKVPKYGVFLVRIFLYLLQIQKNMDQKNLHIWSLFT